MVLSSNLVCPSFLHDLQQKNLMIHEILGPISNQHNMTDEWLKGEL